MSICRKVPSRVERPPCNLGVLTLPALQRRNDRPMHLQPAAAHPGRSGADLFAYAKASPRLAEQNALIALSFSVIPCPCAFACRGTTAMR